MWRPLVGLVFVLTISNCAITERNNFTRDRLEGTGNEPSISIDKITGGTYSDGAFSIGYGKNKTSGATPGIPSGHPSDHDTPINQNVPFNGDSNELGEGVPTKPNQHDGVNDNSSASRISAWLLALVMPLISFFERLF